MADSNTTRILVVSGNYNVIQRVRQSLRGSNHIAIQTAYSYADSVYSLENGDFDAVIVDAGMVNRKSKERTFLALSPINHDMPVIAVDDRGEIGNGFQLPSNVTVSVFEERALLQNISSTLELPLPNTGILTRPAFEFSESNGRSQSVDEIQTLFSLSKSLTEVLELSEVLNRVVEAARRLTSAEEGMILLPDEEGGELYLRAKVGIDVEVARNFRIKTEDTLAGSVFASSKPVLMGDQGPLKVKTEYLVNALLYVPIIYEGKCIGVLGVNNRSSEAIFQPKHQELLQNLASFAAISIENARIHEEALERTRELQALVEASQVLNASLSLDKTLPNICEQLMRIVNVNLAEIYELDRESNQLRAMARCFRTLWTSGQGTVFDLSQRQVIQIAMENNQTIVVSVDDAESPANEIELLKRSGAEMLLILPILGGSQSLGVVMFSYIQPPSRLPDVEVLQRVQHTTLETLLTMSGQQTPGRSQSVFRAVEESIRLTKADWCEIAVLRPDKKSLSINLSVGKGVWLAPPQPALDLGRYSDIADMMQSQTAIVRNADEKATPGIRALFDVIHSRAILGLPLVQRGQTKGLVLFSDSRKNRVFSERDINMGSAIVGQAATALENARLVHSLERSLNELRETQGRLVQTARLSAMGELAAAVAHQINNPLTTIMVDSEMLLMDEDPKSRDFKSLQSIHRAGKRAAGVARRLLAITRPTDPESPPDRIDVVDTIEGVLSLVKSHIERDRIQIVSQMPEEPLPIVWAVPGQLDDIWLNLLLNAHDALVGREGAKVGIRASYRPGDAYIEVDVWDNGPGIPAKIVDEIFKPFFTTKPVGEGTGLGLHICRQTAERIGGSITVSSTPGEGTEFLVRLPVNRRQGDQL